MHSQDTDIRETIEMSGRTGGEGEREMERSDREREARRSGEIFTAESGGSFERGQRLATTYVFFQRNTILIFYIGV